MCIKMFESFMESLNESNRSKGLSLDQAVEVFNLNCTEFDIDSNLLYREYTPRGAYTEYVITDPSLVKRSSKYYSVQNGLINDYAEKHKSWKGFTRSNVVIGSTKPLPVTHSFGDVTYYMIPFDGAIINVCPTIDFNRGSAIHLTDLCGEHIETLQEKTSLLGDLEYLGWDDVSRMFVAAVGEVEWFPKLELLNKLKKANKADVNDRKSLAKGWGKTGVIIFNVLWDVFEEHKDDRGWSNLYDMFEEVMDPVNNGFKRYSIKELQNNKDLFKEWGLGSAPQGKEIYTESKCLLVSWDAFEEFKNEVKQTKGS